MVKLICLAIWYDIIARPHLEPLLLFICIYNLVTNIQSEKLMFTDGIKLFSSVDSEGVQDDINAEFLWHNKCRLFLNVSK